MRLGRFQVSAEGLLALGLLVALSLGGVRCAAYRQGGDDARLATLEANAHKSSLAGIQARRATDSVISAGAVIRQRVISLSADNRRLSAQLGAVLDANDSILRLPPDSTDVLLLRLQFAKTTEVARLFRDSTDVLLGSVERLLASQSEERQAWMAEREANTKLVAAKDSVIAALKARECRVLGMRCPSRRTAFAAGVALTLAAVIAR